MKYLNLGLVRKVTIVKKKIMKGFLVLVSKCFWSLEDFCDTSELSNDTPRIGVLFAKISWCPTHVRRDCTKIHRIYFDAIIQSSEETSWKMVQWYENQTSQTRHNTSLEIFFFYMQPSNLNIVEEFSLKNHGDKKNIYLVKLNRKNYSNFVIISL